MKTTRFSFFLLALFVSVQGLAQSNAPRDYNSAHKNAEKYQKQVMKQRQKQEKAQARQTKAYLKQHPRSSN